VVFTSRATLTLFFTVAVSTVAVYRQMRQVAFGGLGVLLLFSLVGAVAAIVVSRRVTRPLQVLTQGVKDLGSGSGIDINSIKYFYDKAKAICQSSGRACDKYYLIFDNERVSIFNQDKYPIGVFHNDSTKVEEMTQIRDSIADFFEAITLTQ